MKSEAAFSKAEYQIYPDVSGDIACWVCQGLGYNPAELRADITFGFALENRMIGGLIFHDFRPEHDVWWTLYTTDKRWCNRRMLREMFNLAFGKMKCRRINILVSKSNQNSLKFVEKLGFCREGLLRAYREDGEDCYILGMLKNECKWI